MITTINKKAKRQISLLATICSLLFSLSACSDFLDILPMNDVVLENYWTEKADVTSVMNSCYESLESSDALIRMGVWGELRSDNLVKGAGVPNDINEILNENILSSNPYANWAKMYECINRCNTVCHYAPIVQSIDPNYTEEEMRANVAEASALIRSLDPNHLISIGSEGSWGCENDWDCYERICADKNVDYCNIHLWPYNWSWARQDHLIDDLPQAKANTKDYIDKHLDICARLRKPLVMEEFGYPRDDFKFAALGTPTKGRDGFYQYVFSLVADNAEQGGYFAGCNFWGWGGYARPEHEQQWLVGDDYTGDPAQEQQGLNSVFSGDKSTLKVIRSQVKRMKKLR